MEVKESVFGRLVAGAAVASHVHAIAHWVAVTAREMALAARMVQLRAYRLRVSKKRDTVIQDILKIE